MEKTDLSCEVRTKIYEVRRSSKGSSDIYQLFFDKQRALDCAARMQAYYADAEFKQNFCVYEHTAGDILIYSK